jgi:hypothetical protein
MGLPGRGGRVVAWLGMAVLAAGGVYAWWWLHRQSAFEEHLRQGHARAARLLEPVATLPGELAESSGIAVSRTNAGVLWSHNDSGDGPVLYAVDISGGLLGQVRLPRAASHDWEDMSSGPCPRGFSRASPDSDAPASCLYIGDIGDNRRVRTELTIHVVAEPVLGRPGGLPPAIEARSIRFRYPQGRDDSEALAVGLQGDVIVVTKGRTGVLGFFRIPAAQVARALQTGEVLTAEHQMDVPLEEDHALVPLVTGAALSPDGGTLAVRTYHEVFFYRAEATDGSGPPWRRIGPPCFLGDAEPQGEGIDYLDGGTLILTSERARGRPGRMHRLRC